MAAQISHERGNLKGEGAARCKVQRIGANWQIRLNRPSAAATRLMSNYLDHLLYFMHYYRSPHGRICTKFGTGVRVAVEITYMIFSNQLRGVDYAARGQTVFSHWQAQLSATQHWCYAAAHVQWRIRAREPLIFLRDQNLVKFADLFCPCTNQCEIWHETSHRRLGLLH